jgi:two-component system, OmpR family, response regulator MprA
MEHARTLGRVLFADDDLLLRKMVRFILMESGYEVSVADGAAAAMHLLEQEEVHLIILDVGMAGTNGLDCCRQLRARGATQPVLFLSGHKDLADKVAGFEVGGDDYLAKPFEPRELLARVRALLSRQFWGTAQPAGNLVHFDALTLDVTNLAAHLPDGRVVALTPTELRVLQYLLINAGRVVPRERILQAGWGYNYESASNQVDVYIRRLRRKIEGHGSAAAIQTVRGLGYRVVVGSAPTPLEPVVSSRSESPTPSAFQSG